MLQADSPIPIKGRWAFRPGMIALIAAVSAALGFRLYLLLTQNFPANDGGLFVNFIRAAAATFPLLPTRVEYNGLVLPFSYPPLAFWLGALLAKLGFGGVALVRVLPILFNMVTVVLFALVLVRNGRSPWFAALAVAFWAVMLRSFEWLLMGGGLTRGLGAAFLMLTLLAVRVPDPARRGTPGRWRMVVAGLAVGGAILSHLEWGILAASSLVLSRALGSASLKEFVSSCLVAGLTALVVVLPWLAFVEVTNGLEPFFAAAGTSGWKWDDIGTRLLQDLENAAWLNPLTVVGLLVLLAKREWFWIGFALLCEVLTPRHAPTPLAIPAAVAAAAGGMWLYGMAVRWFGDRPAIKVAAAIVVAALAGHGIHQALAKAPTSFRILPSPARQAMAWVAATHPGKRFAVLNDRAWQNDSSAEWFPVLAHAVSTTTAQGREWNGQLKRWTWMYFRTMRSRNCEQLLVELRRFGPYDFVWAERAHFCFETPAFRRVHQSGRVGIYEPVAQPPSLIPSAPGLAPPAGPTGHDAGPGSAPPRTAGPGLPEG